MSEETTGSASQPSSSSPAEKQILERLAFESLKEQKRARRWGIFFKILLALYLLIVLIMVQSGKPTLPTGDYTAMVELNGPIAADETANADDIAVALRDAFEAPGTKGVIIRANSPGGSPVQAGYIYDEIIRLRKKYPDIPLHVVIMDYCASACYYIAAAAENIYANKASTVGSIGVLYNAFGLVGLIDKLGIERRLLTAGENKGFMDMFSPLEDTDRRHAQSILDRVHLQFIDAVKKGRGDRLNPTDEIFSGLFWTGDKAEEMGLMDRAPVLPLPATPRAGAPDLHPSPQSGRGTGSDGSGTVGRSREQAVSL